MLSADENASAFVRQSTRTRDAVLPAIDRRCTLLLHLANVSNPVRDNLSMHGRIAEAIEHSNINQVILPQSFSTLGELNGAKADPSELNFGFRVTMNDPYPLGKLAAEKFWLEWQSQRSDRRLLLLYVPVILGPHSNWTTEIARFAPEQLLLVPKVQRFFGIREEDLVTVLKYWFQTGLNAGVERRLAVTICSPLSEAIAMDRAGSVREIDLPAIFRPIWSFAERSRLASKVLNVQLQLAKKMLRAASTRNIAPLSPKYFNLFLR